MAIINIITAFHVPGISLLTVMYAILPASYDDNVNLNFLPCIFFISDCIWNRCVCTYIYVHKYFMASFPVILFSVAAQ